jgi:hypothetical protein
MGTYLKIAPQNTNVTFTSVNASDINTTTLTSSYALFDTGSGYFEGTFSGSFIGTINTSAPLFVSASKGYLSYVNTSTLTVVNTGSIDNILIIQDATGSAFTINNQGVTTIKTFTGNAPTPVTGGIYFTPYDMYIGTEDVLPSL